MSEQVETRHVPSIGGGRINKTILGWAIAFLLVIGGSAAAGAYYKYIHVPSTEDAVLLAHTGKIDQADWLFEPEPIQEPPKPEPKIEVEAVKEPQPIEAAAKPQAPRPTLMASDLFKTVPRSTMQVTIAKINDMRRGASGVKGQKDLYGTVDESQYLMSQEKWDEKQTIASYPIDMTRVIPIYMSIPATLVHEINSELAGKVVAQIDQHIYGGHGRKVLIPAGSYATGYYYPLKEEGQERLMITWVRIDTPSGINIHTEDAEMADAMGRAGITGEIDHKYWDKYGMPLLMTTIQAVASYTVPVSNDAQASLVNNYGSSVATMGQQILDENIDIAPTITIKAGEHILINPMKDIWFKEPVRKTIQAVAVED